jgi:hypothetical protein
MLAAAIFSTGFLTGSVEKPPALVLRCAIFTFVPNLHTALVRIRGDSQ